MRCSISAGVAKLGTLCASDPGVCCPFEGFDRCAKGGKVRCVNNDGFIRCLVGGTAKPGVLCGGKGKEEYCCPNPLRCCVNGCCEQGTGGNLSLEPFPRIVLGLRPERGGKRVVGNPQRPKGDPGVKGRAGEATGPNA